MINRADYNEWVAIFVTFGKKSFQIYVVAVSAGDYYRNWRQWGDLDRRGLW